MIDEYPDQVMLCSDDVHPDELLLGHINQLAARAVKSGRELMNTLQTACVNPVEHYALDVGMLRAGDPADFIVVNDLTCEAVGNHCSQLSDGLNQIGVSIRSPFMTLSFMALLVIPSLKISDQSLFDVEQFDFVNRFDDSISKP